ncbi:MAG: Hsp20/alpha crystallin family protein [Bdellovibrionales bacterium]
MNLPSLMRSRMEEPARLLTRLQNDFERLFRDFSETRPSTAFATEEFYPTCELNENKSSYIMKFDMPGVKKDDVKIELDGNQLTVSAERREEKKSEDHRSRYSEISYGSYQRSFTLPSAVDDKKVDAKFENGELTLTMPKIESSKAKQIAIH